MFEHRRQFALAHGIPYSKMRHVMPDTLRQLENCKSEEAIRLLLGLSRKEKRPCPKRSARPNTNRKTTTAKQ